MKIVCPICNIEQKNQPTKTWSYGKMIKKRTKSGTVWGASVNCSQYYCKCGKPFKLYLTSNGKSWTILKVKLKKQ